MIYSGKKNQLKKSSSRKSLCSNQKDIQSRKSSFTTVQRVNLKMSYKAFCYNLSVDNIENKRSIVRVLEAIFKIKDTEPEKKKSGQIQKLVRKIWTGFQEQKLWVNWNAIESFQIYSRVF